MLPLSVGFLIAGPISGRLADHFGARPFATGGMIVSAIGFLLLVALPINFTYWEFGLVIFLIGAAMGLFAAPNLTGIMNSLPPDQRGVGRRHGRDLPELRVGAVDRGVLQPDHRRPVIDAARRAVPRPGVARRAARRRHAGLEAAARGSLFASFLGYNPVGTLLAPTLPHLPHATAAYLTGHKFFPTLVSHPFASGIHTVFYFAAGLLPGGGGRLVDARAASTTTRTRPRARSRRTSSSRSPDSRPSICARWWNRGSGRTPPPRGVEQSGDRTARRCELVPSDTPAAPSPSSR